MATIDEGPDNAPSICHDIAVITGAMTLASVHGAVPPAAVMCLGRQLAAVLGATATMAPERIIVDDRGGLLVQPGPVGPRWRAPEVRGQSSLTTPSTADLWSLGRLLLELSLGHPVEDQLADHADEERMQTLADVNGHQLAPRLIEVLMVLLARSPDNRLQSPVAASRVFAEAERQFGDGEQALAEVLARCRGPKMGSPTMAMASADVLPQVELARLAREAAQERRRQQQVPTQATKDLPARAILTEEELANMPIPPEPPAQAQLPPRSGESGEAETAADDVQDGIDFGAVVHTQSDHTLPESCETPVALQPEAPTLPEPTVPLVLQLAEVATRPLITATAAPVATEMSSPHLLPDLQQMSSTGEPGEDAMVRAFQQGQRRQRTVMALLAAVVVIVVLVVVGVALN